jgi:hypothetical protein
LEVEYSRFVRSVILHSQTVRVDKMESGDPAGSSHSNPSQFVWPDHLLELDLENNMRYYQSRLFGTSHSDSGFTLPVVGEKRDRHTWNFYDEGTLEELVGVKKKQSGYCTSEVLAEEDVATKYTLRKKQRHLRVGRKFGMVSRELGGKWVAESDLGKGGLQRLGPFDTEEEATIALRAAAKLNFADGQIPSTISTLAYASATPLEGDESHFTYFTALYSMGDMPQALTLDYQLCQIVCSFD